MVRLPHEFYPGLEDLDEREARRFAVSVLEAAEYNRAVEIRDGYPHAGAEVIAAVAAQMSAVERT